MPNDGWRGVHRGRAAVLTIPDIDTDQIIPARFLKATGRAGLGAGLFADWRLTTEGAVRGDHPINRGRARGATILVAGRNFGCGSSREHAAWALTDFGFRAVIAPSFSDIFRGNALENTLLPIALAPDEWEELVARLDAAPDSEILIDLETTTVTADGWRAVFPIDGFARHCLLQGIDSLGYLLSQADAIARFERDHPLPDLRSIFGEASDGR